MSTTIPLAESLTPAQRTNVALERAKTILPEATNIKLLQAVILEAVAEALTSGEAIFIARIRERYAAETASKARAPKRQSTRPPRVTPKVSDFVEPLIPIKHIPNYEVSLAGPPDPDILFEVFGSHQLAKALDQRSAADLRKAAALVQERHPGTKPQPKANKAGLIAYIVEQVVGSTTS